MNVWCEMWIQGFRLYCLGWRCLGEDRRARAEQGELIFSLSQLFSAIPPFTLKRQQRLHCTSATFETVLFVIKIGLVNLLSRQVTLFQVYHTSVVTSRGLLLVRPTWMGLPCSQQNSHQSPMKTVPQIPEDLWDSGIFKNFQTFSEIYRESEIFRGIYLYLTLFDHIQSNLVIILWSSL